MKIFCITFRWCIYLNAFSSIAILSFVRFEYNALIMMHCSIVFHALRCYYQNKKHKNCSSTTNIWCCFMSGDRSVKLVRYKSVFMTSFNTRSSKDFQILSSFSRKASHFVWDPLYGNGNIADCRELTLHFNEGESCALSLFIINRRN